MEKPYQILLIEDDSSDAELIEIQLNKLDMDYDLRVISKQAELAHLLTEQLPDLIISDYNLPGFTGLETLNMVREKEPELPFILISGYIGEEQAVDAMRRGASDYVVKERLGRLGPAVKRELTNLREREKSRQELKESQDRFRALVEHGNDVVFILSPEGNPFYVSPSIKKVLGYTMNEGLNLDISNMVHPDEREIIIEELSRAIENPGEPIQVKPARMKHKNGSWRWFGGTITNMLHEPSIGGIVDNFRDITDQIVVEKKLSNAKEKYESLIQSIDGIVWEAKADTFEFTFVSNQVKDVLGYSPEQWLEEESFWENHIHPDDRDEAVRYCQNQTKAGRNHTFEYRMKSSGGIYLWIRDVVTVVRKEGGQDFLRGLMLDISGTKALEKTLEKTYEYAQIGNWELDLVGDKLTWSPMIKKLHEVEPEYEPDLKSGIEFYEEGWSRQQIKQVVERAIDTGEPFDVEAKLITAKGNRRWIRAIGNPDFVDGKCVRLFGSSQDITERKTQQEKLKSTEQKLRNIVEHSTNMFYTHDLEGVLTYVSPQSEKFLGYSTDEAIRGWTEFITDHPVNKEGEKYTERAIKTGKAQPPYELQLKKADGSLIWVEVNEAPLVKDGKTTAIVGSLTDITERKIFEQDLISSNEKLNTAQRIAKLGYWELNLENDEIYWSDEVYRIWGREPEDYKPSMQAFVDSIHPDDLDQVIESHEKAVQGKTEHDVVHRIFLPDGTLKWVHEKGSLRRDADDNKVSFEGTVQDVTEAKQVEIQNQLQQKVAHYFKKDNRLKVTLQKVLKYLTGFGEFNTAEIWLTGIEKKHLNLISTYAKNKSARQFYKESRDKKRFTKGEGFPGTVWEKQKIEIWGAIDTGQEFIRNGAAQKAGLKSALGIPIFHNDELIGVLVFYSNKSSEEIKNVVNPYKAVQDFLGAEIIRKRQEEEMYLLFQSAPDILAITSPNGRFTKVNPEFCELMGYNEEELTSQSYQNFVHPEDLKISQKEYSKTITGERQADNFINRWRTKSGEYRWISWNSSKVFSEDGFVFSYGRDITEMKELENLLNQANRLAKVGSWELSLISQNGGSMYWSETTREILEVDGDYDPSETSGFEFFEDESKKIIEKAFEKSISEGTSFDRELKLTTAKGNNRWVRCIGEADYVEGTCIRIYGSFQDVTAEKEAEQEKVDILESIKDAFFALDNNWIVTYWNKEAEKILGKSRTEVIGKNLWDEYADATELEFYSQYHKAVDEQKTVHFEEYYPTLDKWFEVSAYPSEKGLSVYFKNVTDRKKATIALEEAYKEKEIILDSIGDGFFTVDKNWIVTYWNRAAERMLETPKEVILGNNLWDIFADAVDLPSYTNYHLVMSEGEPIDFEDYYEALQKWFDVSAYPSPDGISVFFKNITDRKESEEHIKKINERFEKVTEATNDAIWDFDVENEKLFWGKGFSTLFEYDLEKITPSFDFLIGLIHPEDRERVVQKVNHFFQDSSSTNWFEEYRFMKDNGSYAYVIDRAIFIRDESGKVVRVVGAMTDLTRQKEYEESLKELNIKLVQRAEELAASNAELEQFAYVASHDLQEPLRMVTSFLTQLEKKYEDQLDEKAQQYIHFAVDGASRMRQIILDLLNYSRVGRGGYDKTMLSLDILLNEILTLEHANIEESGAEIAWDKLPSITAAETPIKQVLKNLINNALKYQTPGTKPIIHISGQEEKSHWRISVSDNGIGIRKEFQDSIFTIFQRLHTRDQYSGTGIGLAVCRKIVEKHGGEIWVESAEGEGSTFHFTIAKSLDQ